MKCVLPPDSDIPTERLEEVISDKDMATIARKYLTNWQLLRSYLGLTRQQEVEIRSTYNNDYGMQKNECLQVWKEMRGIEATYGALITAAEEAEEQQLADHVKTMLAARASST